jgi:hypothetical protein
MTIGGKAAGFVGVVAIVCGLSAGRTAAEDKDSHWTSSSLPLAKLPTDVRERVSSVVDHPALYTHGPSEEILCDPTTYFWLLDHPDRATRAWTRLGAKCVDIQDGGDDWFGCSDASGNDVRWTTVYQTAEMRIWYAEGTIKVGGLLKPVTGEAVLVVRHVEGTDAKGRSVIRQQTDMILHADTKTAAFVAKVLGAAMPQLAEQYVMHQGKFFSLLATYLWLHPDKSSALLAAKSPDEPNESSLAIPTSALKARDIMKGVAPK